MFFSKPLEQCEMQIVLTRIWTWFPNSIFYEEKHYVKHNSMKMSAYVFEMDAIKNRDSYL